MLALVGVAVGCAAVIALLNIGNSAANATVEAFKGLGAQLLVASFGIQADNPQAPPPRLDTAALKHSIPAIRYMAPVALHAAPVRLRGSSADAAIVGTTAELLPILNLGMASGRFLTAFDQQATYVVLGAQLARQLNVVLGSQLQLEGYVFDVIGILAAHPFNPMLPINLDESILLPLEGMRRIQPAPQIALVLAWASESSTLPSTASALKTHLQADNDHHDVEVQIPRQLVEGLSRQADTFTYLLAGLGGIALLIGGVGIMNVMLMSVSERRREIGVRMALGAQSRDIRNLFLAEAVVLSGSGAVLGAMLGLGVARLFVGFSGWAFTWAPASLPLGLGSALLTGVFFGLHPALLAARLQPIQALRDD
ncbi:ABC transporter permease [Pseudomonas sp. SDI]|nr:ABC transporter permease [Pseudomonas sp. SDI]